MTSRPTAPPAPPPAVQPMTGIELRVAGERLYGTRGWQKGLGSALDLDVSTIRRYVDSGRVPLVVAAAIRHLERLQQGASGSASPADPRSAVQACGPSTAGASPIDAQALRQRSSVGR